MTKLCGFYSISAKPYFLYPLRDLVVDEESHVTLRCDALGKPRPTFSWYKNSQPLVPVAGEIEIVSNVLTILRTQVGKHGGMYECTATNTHGTAITSAQVKVLCTSQTFFIWMVLNFVFTNQFIACLLTLKKIFIKVDNIFSTSTHVH